MRSPTNIKDVQQLTRRMTALSRFLSASGDKGYPYFHCLKKNNRFVWTKECEQAFTKLKEYLASPPVLGKPIPGTPVRLYFAIINRTINSVILQDQDKVQKPVYFVSKVLQVPKTWHHAIEKAALVVVFTARQLLPIRKDLQKPDIAGQMIHWVVELPEFDIQYEPREPIKGQVYVDFLVELSSDNN